MAEYGHVGQDEAAAELGDCLPRPHRRLRELVAALDQPLLAYVKVLALQGVRGGAGDKTQEELAAGLQRDGGGVTTRQAVGGVPQLALQPHHRRRFTLLHHRRQRLDGGNSDSHVGAAHQRLMELFHNDRVAADAGVEGGAARGDAFIRIVEGAGAQGAPGDDGHRKGRVPGVAVASIRRGLLCFAAANQRRDAALVHDG
mmetsp:Transcript_5752/g.15007  ORF Transcript_5752/g.15007 Transcript_5752/m.15007 type:complete len:200 (-) Transcript_5752:221-820(-)